MADDTRPNWSVVEHQVWKACAAAGMMSFGLGAATFFLYFLLHSLEATTKISSIGLSGTAAIVLASLLFSRIVVGRLSQYAVVTLLSISAFIGQLIVASPETDTDEIEKQRSKTELQAILSFGVLGALGISFFLTWRWTCADANPTGGFMHAVCTGSNHGIFQAVQIEVLHLSGGAWGVGGVFLTIVALLEVQAAWRGSWLQKRFRSSGLYVWLRPMEDFKSSLADDSETDE